ncbi:MAG: hypothetical protein Q7S82_01665 [bacterium]|nr:hypothetical protein [bacterium]
MYQSSTTSLPNVRIFRYRVPLYGNRYLKLFWISIFFLILFLIIFSIFQLNAYTKTYYSIQSAQNQLVQLTKENGNLKIGFSNTSSLNNIEEHIRNFEAINKIEYIRILEVTVLAK